MEMIRRLQEDEKYLADKIASMSFNFHYEEQKKEPQSPAWPAEWIWGYFTAGKLTSCLTDIPYTIQFDGKTANMAGIGGVCSLPEDRRKGQIRKLMEAVLREEYEKRTEFSGLTPFSHSFYRKFGYEVCNDRKEIVLPAVAFKNRKTTGSFAQHFPGDPTCDLQSIHKKYIQNLNQAIARDSWKNNLAWRIFTNQSPYKDDVFTYIWYNTTGEPCSYLSFYREMQEFNAILRIREIIYTDKESLQNAIAFFSLLNFHEFRWQAPIFTPVADLFPENWVFTQTISPRDMIRVVHVEHALKKMRIPDGECEYILEIQDPLLPENCGNFVVSYGPEGSQVKKTKRPADLACDIPSLSQLITGYRTLDDILVCKEGIILYKNKELLRRVFTHRPSHLSENF